jgi:protein involved in polysaccharide export with SLBB domain
MNMICKAASGLLFAALLMLAGTTLVSAQVPPSAQTPTPEQMQMLRQLPESQRRELMRAMGVRDTARAETELEFPETVLPPEPELPEPEGPPRLKAESTIIVWLTLPELEEPNRQRERELEETFRRNPQLESVKGAATYVLDKAGRIHFPGIASIPLAGLTELEAARRVEAEPNLRIFEAEVMLLPLERFGAEILEPFGYELFQGTPVTFAPATDVPVPADYTLGPGDQVRVQLFGKESADYTLVVNRDGSLNFPQIGPIVVAGLNFGQMRDLIQQRVADQMIGVNVSVTMGELRSIRVFVLGDVTRPGSFTVSGLSTMTNALFVSGGISPVGSMRDVQLKRNGELVQRLDLYDLLLNGDNRGDARLMPNDVLFVPPRGPTVAVSGEVQRPAIYELAGERSLGQVIRLAGGLMPTAFAGAVRLERVDQAGGRSVQTLDLGSSVGRDAAVRGGDIVSVGPVLDLLTDHVSLAGHVQRPGAYEWRPGMRLTDLVGSVNQLKPDADRHYVLIQRQPDLSGAIELFSADLVVALSNPRGPGNPELRNLDEVIFFDLGSGRVAVMDPLLEQLRRQAVFGNPARVVTVGGMVRAPGSYPLEDGMTISDLVRAGASLADSAYGLTAELTRYEVRDGTRRVVDLVEVDLSAVLAGDLSADLRLQPFDHLNIKEVSEWRRQGRVELRGEVRFPGEYFIEPGERLSNVITRAGGLTEQAFLSGSVFLREDLRRREGEQIQRLVNRLEADLATLAMQASRAAAVQGGGARADQSMGVGQALLTQLRRTQPVGRLVIDLPAVLSGDDANDVVLKDGDTLIVPERSQEVTVLGEVQYATSHIHAPGLSRNDYIGASGGLTANADERRIYIVRANGAVVAGDGSSKWFRQSGAMDVRPGDSIIVPMNVDRVPALALWQSASTIVFNLAVAVAAIGGL